MKRLVVLMAMLMATVASIAQDSDKVSIKPYGFIRNYLTFDSRKT